ncbi:MAG: hypothetical protein L3J93_04550, partial [Thermoplasmata archaeon]|nr:hypothetical protein [Thermoplasmata archaeon]
DQVLEVRDEAGTPTVVAVAYPSQIATSNGSTPGSSSPNLVSLSAALTVYPANASLWAEHGALVAPIGGPTGSARLAIEYSVGTGSAPGSGVLLNWSIDSWVWSTTTDLLGLQLGMQTPQGVGIVACNGVLDSDALVPCTGTTLASGGSIWAGSIGGVEDRSASGAAATVSWASTASAGSASPATITAGVLAQSSVEAQLLLAAAGSGSSHLSGSVSFTLHPPVALPPAPALIHGQADWFGGALLGFAFACSLGAFGYRRAVRRSESEL